MQKVSTWNEQVESKNQNEQNSKRFFDHSLSAEESLCPHWGSNDNQSQQLERDRVPLSSRTADDSKACPAAKEQIIRVDEGSGNEQERVKKD